MGGIGKRIPIQNWPLTKSTRSYLKNNYSKKEYGSGGRARAQGPKLKPQYHHQKKKKSHFDSEPNH
jgi:hypothetical protein